MAKSLYFLLMFFICLPNISKSASSMKSMLLGYSEFNEYSGEDNDFLSTPLEYGSEPVTVRIKRDRKAMSPEIVSMFFEKTKNTDFSAQLENKNILLVATGTSYLQKAKDKINGSSLSLYKIYPWSSYNNEKWKLYKSTSRPTNDYNLNLINSNYFMNRTVLHVSRTKRSIYDEIGPLKTILQLVDPATGSISHSLKNRKPKWSKKIGGYTVNTHGVKGVASVKTLVVANGDDDPFILVRQIDDSFIVRFSYPFSPVQAFALALSTFDG